MTLSRLSNLSALSVSSCPAINDSVLAAFADGRRAALSRQGSGDAAAHAAHAAHAAPPPACGALVAAA